MYSPSTQCEDGKSRQSHSGITQDIWQRDRKEPAQTEMKIQKHDMLAAHYLYQRYSITTLLIRTSLALPFTSMYIFNLSSKQSWIISSNEGTRSSGNWALSVQCVTETTNANQLSNFHTLIWMLCWCRERFDRVQCHLVDISHSISCSIHRVIVNHNRDSVNRVINVKLDRVSSILLCL